MLATLDEPNRIKSNAGVGDQDEKRNKLDYIQAAARSDDEFLRDSIEDFGLVFDMPVVGHTNSRVSLGKDGGTRPVRQRSCL
eukprot:SAG22_NODE_1094_length_5587_cov_6.950580_3_plen_82_part_00